jgi:hypothetical protein
MNDEDPVNRMVERPNLEHLRETSVHPTWWSRTWDKFVLTFRSRTTITILLAVTIIIAILAGVLVLT